MPHSTKSLTPDSTLPEEPIIVLFLSEGGGPGFQIDMLAIRNIVREQPVNCKI
jgi:hypothetical protein